MAEKCNSNGLQSSFAEENVSCEEIMDVDKATGDADIVKLSDGSKDEHNVPEVGKDIVPDTNNSSESSTKTENELNMGNDAKSKSGKTFQSFDEVLSHMNRVITDRLKKLESEKDQVQIGKLMCELRKCIADPITDGFSPKISQAQYEQLLQAALDLNTGKVVSSCIFQYQDQNITSQDVDYLVNCFWILTNISSGRTQLTKAVIDTGVVPFAMDIVNNCPLIPLVTQCLMLLGNVLVDDIDIMNEILFKGLYKKVHGMFYSVEKSCKAQIIHLYFSIKKTAQGTLPQEIMFQMIHQATYLLYSGEVADILRPAMDLIFECSNQNYSDIINIFLEFGYMTQLMSCMSHPNALVRNRCLLAVGNLVLGTDQQTWGVLKSGILTHLTALLYYDDLDTVKNTLWILSNIAAGDERMIYGFFDFDIFDSVLFYLKSEYPELEKEALWTVANLVRDCDGYIYKNHLLKNRDMVGNLVQLVHKHTEAESMDELTYLDLIHESLVKIFEYLRNESSEVQTSCKQLYTELGMQTAFGKVADSDSDRFGDVRDKYDYLKTSFEELGKEDED